MDRVKTGIMGLDELIDGGIPRGSSVLLTGSCGTGKTILSLQYLYQGALSEEPGVYVTFEESREKILEQTTAFGWDIERLEQENLLRIYVVDTDDIEDILAKIKELVNEISAKRLVLDSLTTMMEHGVIYRSQISKDMSKYGKRGRIFKFPGHGSEITRKDVYFIVGEINKIGTTAILISEVGEDSNFLSRDTISEFACDGVILLKNDAIGGGIERLLSVRKMRGTRIDMTLTIIKFTENGIVIEH